MFSASEFRARVHLEHGVLETWVAEGWLIPSRGGEDVEYAEIDIARVHLIRDLSGDLGVNDEGVGVILALLDQIHSLRSTMTEMMAALAAQPDDVKARLTAEIQNVRQRADT